MSAETSGFKTRKPTGKPPWPLILFAGVEKSGKSYGAAAFSASDLIDRTFWIEIGEGAADQYGALPGARYEIVEHNGTYVDIGRAIKGAMSQPRPNGKPHAIVIDSATELWDMLADEQQAIANARANRGRNANGDATVTVDQWNSAKKRWRRMIDALRVYDGPVILTARLELVTVMGNNGQPTTAKTWKVRTEKNLPFEADVVVQIPAPRQFEITGLRSVRLQMPESGTMPMPDFTIDGLLRKLGLAEVGATSTRSYTAPTPDAAEAAADAEADTRTQGQRGPAMATQVQLTRLNILLKTKMGFTDDTERLKALSGRVKRKLASSKELSRAEVRTLIDELDKMPDKAPPPELSGLAAELLASIEGAATLDELADAKLGIDGAAAKGSINHTDRDYLVGKHAARGRDLAARTEAVA